MSFHENVKKGSQLVVVDKFAMFDKFTRATQRAHPKNFVLVYVA